MNFKQSEISFYYGNLLQYFNEIWFDKNETFTFEDGSQYHRSQYAEANKKKNLQQWGAVTYNLQEADKYMLNATVGFSHYNDPDLRMKGKLHTEEFPNSVTDREEWNHDRNLSPYLDIYFQKNLKHKQFLALNVVGTYINTKNRSSYTELLSGEPVVDYYSGIRGKKYSLIGEGIYEKAFKDGGKLSVGVRHTQGYTDNDYNGTLQYSSQMKQADTYAYAQYNGKWDVGLRNQYNYRDKAIMPHIYREDDRFIHSYANHSNFQDWTVGLDARVGMLWDVLQLSGSIESRKYWSNGIDFRHTQHSIGWDVAATFMYKNFTASVEFQHNSDYFFGEVLATGEEAHAIDLQYRWKRLNVGLRL